MTHDEIAENNLFHAEIKNVESAQNPEIWNFEQNYSGPSGDFAQYLHPLQDNLEEAVIRRITYRKGSIGVLFSGGLDCSLVAYFTLSYFHRNLPNEKLYLFSVAFGKTENDFELCPDRKTAISSYEELRNLFPDLKIELIKIDVYKPELDEMRKSRIRDLLSPRISVLDDSIGCALWFASHSDKAPDCRLLLSGLGADELFCGYSCHRIGF